MTGPNFGLVAGRLNAPRLIGLIANDVAAHGCGHDCIEHPVADWCKPCLLALWASLDLEVRTVCRKAHVCADVLAFNRSAGPKAVAR